MPPGEGIMKSHPATIKDIAKALGISVSTVSRALKDHPDISEKTRLMVKEMAEKLQYKPNALALSLRSNRSNTIGVIVPEIVHHFFSTVISGIEDYAYERGYNVMVCQSNELQEREAINAQALISHRVDGVLISVAKTTQDFSHLHMFLNQGIPVVFFDRVCPEIYVDRVIIDDELGGFLVTEHLIKCGCRHIAHFTAPQNLLIAQGRRAGYERALLQYNLPVRQEMIILCDTYERALEKTGAFLAEHPETDGIFAVNDSTAIGAMQAIQKMGRKIPSDIAVAGFGDGPNALICTPTLTTVEQKGYEIGMESVELLIRKIEEKENTALATESTEEKDAAKKGVRAKFETKVIIPNLIVRESTMRFPAVAQTF